MSNKYKIINLDNKEILDNIFNAKEIEVENIFMKKINLILLVILLFIPSITFSQVFFTEKTEVNELKVNDNNFFVAIDTLLSAYNNCPFKDSIYSWEIFIKKDNPINDGFIIYIYTSNLNDGIFESKGFFYYKNVLFVVREDSISSLFSKTEKSKDFLLYKKNPSHVTIMNNDGPEFLFSYDNNNYHLIKSFPCGK